jgi:hypothetical protein
MVDSTNLQDEPFLQLGQREQSPLTGVILSALSGGGKRRARKQMNLTHHGSNETFDMTAKMRPMNWPPAQLDAVFLTASLQRL